MRKQNFKIDNIPAILWGSKTKHLIVAVHGSMSRKDDTVISMLAEEAVSKGYQVLSFDLPQHGDRKNDTSYLCKTENCKKDLKTIMAYAHTLSDNISLFGCSMGAYFSLLAYKDEPLNQCLFLSPVVDMKRLIDSMMSYCSISEEMLVNQKVIATKIGQTLYYDDYCYVKENPINEWDKPTSILYGRNDTTCAFDTITSFKDKFNCCLTIMPDGEHYFHTAEQLSFYKEWLYENIEKI